MIVGLYFDNDLFTTLFKLLKNFILYKYNHSLKAQAIWIQKSKICRKIASSVDHGQSLLFYEQYELVLHSLPRLCLRTLDHQQKK